MGVESWSHLCVHTCVIARLARASLSRDKRPLIPICARSKDPSSDPSSDQSKKVLNHPRHAVGPSPAPVTTRKPHHRPCVPLPPADMDVDETWMRAGPLEAPAVHQVGSVAASRSGTPCLGDWTPQIFSHIFRPSQCRLPKQSE